MNDFSDLHTPRPEFRAALENDLVGALRRETRFSPYKRIARSARIRTVMLIVVGAALGVGCGYASAQVRESQTRSELLMAAEASLKLSSLRLEMAQARLKQSRSQFEVGVISRGELISAESEVRMRETELAKTQLDMEEIRASATSPRDELWAPLVGGRDFVKQRLELRAALAQQRLTEAETQFNEVDRRVRMGAGAAITTNEAQGTLLEAQRAFESLAQQLTLRRQFIGNDLKAEDISFRQKLLEMQADLASLQAQSKFAEVRASRAREMRAHGVTTEIEVKRAELELLELQFKLEEIKLQLQLFQTRKRSQ